MTRAEQAALKAYPKSEGIRELKGLSARPIFIQGYEQAENDTREELLEWAREQFEVYGIITQQGGADIDFGRMNAFSMMINKLESM